MVPIMRKATRDWKLNNTCTWCCDFPCAFSISISSQLVPVSVENTVPASGLGVERKKPRAGHAGIISRTFPVVCIGECSSCQLSRGWGSLDGRKRGQPAAICPPGARPFLSRGLSRAPLAPPVTIHRSKSASAPSFRWIVRWCLLLLLLVVLAPMPQATATASMLPLFSCSGRILPDFLT